ncbi:UNVERIFIED_CONTAM: Non-specific lipid-transfer protein A [Sesamum calycinum]|uniref:Non-specific lipid-transfer protein A n=1 Tax=Sesamum calycinum TaxID=2727403 RepID=A0AAW2T0J6_9LAMI
MKGGIAAVFAILAIISLVVQPGQAAVKVMAETTADKRACCSCVKAAANRYADLKDAAAQSLPTKCGVQMDIPISRSVDCDKIN